MVLCREGKIGLGCFIISIIIATIPEILLRIEFNSYIHEVLINVWLIHLFQYGFLNILLFLTFKGFLYQIAVRSAFLGYIFGIGIIIYFSAPLSWRCFGIYASVLSTFHFSEFLSIAWTNPKAISIDSFILNHSLAYSIAACSSWVEFLIERYYFPDIKSPDFISYAGLTICICGEIVRKLAMFTARDNFNHLVQMEKSETHKLVTNGVYRLSRHPSYVGWFYWSIGTQLILKNPVCFVAYAIASWQFFHNRVILEEITLLNFFGEDYIKYQEMVGTGLPFISGYKINT
ncbi:protein-S-isoprenylcysteine O-methyltransferase [Microplitis mediator]|uniref:protein-S-isoprenylcysteine O-methyltransferase n=1 Tax=Microplitis mediator TaxID=375433 RepID=UPI002555F947|nr:protein-S-isoprenylcysteine O-methyltransferase [Microplitis mediator]